MRLSNPMKPLIVLPILFFLASCALNTRHETSSLVTDLPSSSVPQGTTQKILETRTPTPSMTLTASATITPTPLPPTITPTATWVFQAAGEVVCPILLYHQIADIDPPSQYYMPPADFKAQMEALRDWGYTPITISPVVKAITEGGQLPPRPIVITFDDGDENVYTNAFPVMRELGFPGVLYIISSAVNGQNYLSAAQILEMAAAGWEVGSHSRTHLNLTSDPGQAWAEASQSRQILKADLGIPINTFAYPYGAADAFVMEKVRQFGYQAAVGLGKSALQGPGNLFYLSRIEVKYGTTLDQFAALLPWSIQEP